MNRAEDWLTQSRRRALLSCWVLVSQYYGSDDGSDATALRCCGAVWQSEYVSQSEWNYQAFAKRGWYTHA